MFKMVGREFSLINNDLLCFPSPSNECVARRARKLTEAGIDRILDEGNDIVNEIHVLGKGHSSLVLTALLKDGRKVAVKILRTDSKREDLLLECRLMSLAYPVAPKLFFCDEEFIIMEYLEGLPWKRFLSEYEGDCRLLVLKGLAVLEAGRWLDKVGVRHDELSLVKEHVYVGMRGDVRIIDYESASMGQGCNVCRLFSSIFMRERRIRRCCKEETLQSNGLEVLRRYKLRRDNFAEVISLVKEACLS